MIMEFVDVKGESTPVRPSRRSTSILDHDVLRSPEQIEAVGQQISACKDTMLEGCVFATRCSSTTSLMVKEFVFPRQKAGAKWREECLPHFHDETSA